MKNYPIINKITVDLFAWQTEKLGRDYNTFNLVYDPDSTLKQQEGIVRIHTNVGLTGEHPISSIGIAELKEISSYLIGKNALSREAIYNDTKRALRQSLKQASSIVDICLWDIAGKYFQEPIYRLLGGENMPLKAYASTLHGDENGGLSSPLDFQEFASQCLEMGYKAFKVHGWGLARKNIQREIDTVLSLGRDFEKKLDLLLDPACEVKNFGDALRLGKACDEANFFWWEDPYADGGVSQFAHKKLRQMVRTPLLQTEHIRYLEQHVDFILSEATDFVRAGAYEDGGVTGAMKLAHAAEGFGLDLELHAPSPVHRHIMASIRNTNFYEMGLVHPKIRSYRPEIYIGYNDNLDGIDKNGNVFPPDGYGIGVDIDWEWVNFHLIDSFTIAD